jgi:hypothetical protein
MILPKNEHTFKIDIEGEVTKTKYEGEFTVICKPTLSMKHEHALIKARLMGDVKNPTQDLYYYSELIAFIKTRIVESPKWWNETFKSLNTLDENIIVEVYDNILKASEEWDKQLNSSLSE